MGTAGDCDTGQCSDERIRRAGWPAMTIAAYDTGVFVSVPADTNHPGLEKLPFDLLATFKVARSLNADMVRFDPDAKVFPADLLEHLQ